MLLQRSVINKLAGGILLFEVVKRSAVPLGLGLRELARDRHLWLAASAVDQAGRPFCLAFADPSTPLSQQASRPVVAASKVSGIHQSSGLASEIHQASRHSAPTLCDARYQFIDDAIENDSRRNRYHQLKSGSRQYGTSHARAGSILGGGGKEDMGQHTTADSAQQRHRPPAHPPGRLYHHHGHCPLTRLCRFSPSTFSTPALSTRLASTS